MPYRLSSFVSDNCLFKLYVFSDASRTAFSCSIYLRTVYSNSLESLLIFTKSKVTPKRLKNSLSIHRSKLLGLLIAVRSLTFCYKELV